MDIFQRLEAIFGSAINVSRALKHDNRQTYNNWKRRGKIPADCCMKICAATNWLLKPEELRPDVFDPKRAA
jgi:DNA-binding transcriptional regulator YdaS (Cro superfamily)